MTIERRKSVRTGRISWFVRIELGRDAGGNRLRESVGTFASYEEALAAERRAVVLRALATHDLRGVNFRNADFAGLDLTERDFRGSDFSGSNIELAGKLSAARFDGAKGLTDSQIEKLRSAGAITVDYRESARPGIDWSGVQVALRNANLNCLSLQASSFRHSDLSGATFSGTDLSNADFENAVLNSVSFERAVLFRANLVNASLVNVDFSGCDLSAASLRGALLSGSSILDAESVTGSDLTWTSGLTQEARLACKQRGARVDDIDHPGRTVPDTLRSKEFAQGKHKSMAIVQEQNHRNRLRKQLEDRDEPGLAIMIEELAEALDREAFIGGPFGLNKPRRSEFRDLALSLLARMGDKVEFRVRDVDQGLD